MDSVALLEEWASVNSFSHHPVGLKKMLFMAQEAFLSLEPDVVEALPFGLSLKKRTLSRVQIFLGGHLDTVFPPDHPFQNTTRLDENHLRGPGVADMKGGILVMLHALLEFEKSNEAPEIGWEIFLNLDEEIGSPLSTPYLQQCAQRSHYALLFEPVLPNGSFVSRRKGSSNYRAICHGKAAHAGRSFHEGVNAIYPLAHFISELEGLNDPHTFVNVGHIKGGGPLNIIPDYAEASFNVRSFDDLAPRLERTAEAHGMRLSRLSHRPPKPFDKQTELLFALLKECGKKLHQEIRWEESGGVCDGNTFGAAGIPTIDTLGVEGGRIHTEEEFIYLPSLVTKAKLTTLILKELAKR